MVLKVDQVLNACNINKLELGSELVLISYATREIYNLANSKLDLGYQDGCGGNIRALLH